MKQKHSNMTTEQIQQELEAVNGAFIKLLINDQTPLQIRAKFDELCDRQEFLNKLLRTSMTKEALDSFAKKQLNSEGCLFVGVAALIIGLILCIANIWL